MSHFRIKIHRTALMMIGCIFLIAGCVPEPLLDDATADASGSSESDATWNEDSWWDQDAAADRDTEIADADSDSGQVENDVLDKQDIDDLPSATHPDFLVVADTLRNSCGAAGCHGAAAQGNFAIEGGMNATDAQMRIALEGITTQSGEALIEPGDAEGSELYIRLTLTSGSVMPPQPFPSLEQDKIDEIRDWIDSGAPYE